MAEEVETTETADAGDSTLAGAGGDVQAGDQAGDLGTGGESTGTDKTGSADSSAAAQTAPAGAATGGSSRPADVQRNETVDIDAELNAKETLADKLESGSITYEQYAKACVKHDRRITQAQRQMVEPAKQVQQTQQQQQAAKAYWQNWGKGQDVAQMQYGKSINGNRAKSIFSQVEAEFDANPRYQRPEFQANRDALIYDKFIDALGTESKKPAAARATTTTQTRASGSNGAGGGSAPGTAKTARQRLEEGDYDLGSDAQRLGMI